MKINNTQVFIKLVDDVLKKEHRYFKELEDLKMKKGYPHIRKKVLNDYNIKVIDNNSLNKNDTFKDYIKTINFLNNDNSNIKTSVLYDISKQVQIEYLLNNLSLNNAKLYYSLSKTLQDYGIYRDDEIISFQYSKFWLELIKKLYLLNLINSTGFIDDFKMMYNIDKSIPEFVASIIFLKQDMNVKLSCIDNKIIFDKNQENKIVKLIENKLKQINIFNFINYLLLKNKDNKIIPFNYIINLSIKNIHCSNHKKNDEKTFIYILDIFKHFINLYQLRQVSQWDYVFIDVKNIENKLKKQIQHSNLYLLSYPLQTHTLTGYINNLISNTLTNQEFTNKFKFTKKELIDFLMYCDNAGDNHIIKIDIIQSKYIEHILNFFSINATDINKNYSLPLDNTTTKNLFVHNPIIKYKDDYFIIGFKYFKMYFYSALVEKIRLKLDTSINNKIGDNIDIYVESLFKNKNYDLYSGKYKISKNMIPECDLVIKTNDTIVFIENKNKFLTKNSFAGSSIHILQDFIRSFATSQFQLLRHEHNLLDKKQLNFEDGKILKYNNEQIIKISLSPNNWYSIMNNINPNILLSLINMRFIFKEHTENIDIKNFESTNKDLNKLTTMIEIINNKYDLRKVLHNSLFIPLELICENNSDNNLIKNINGLLSIQFDTVDNIYDRYSIYKKLKAK